MNNYQATPTKQELHRAYTAVYSIRHIFRNRTQRSLVGTNLVHLGDNGWHVIGITPKALAEFANNDFNRIKGMTVSRAHLVNRADTWDDLLSREHTIDEFFAKFIAADKTVLAHKSENARIASIPYIPVPEELGLFKTKGFAYKVGTEEAAWMRGVWSKEFQK